MLTYAPLNGGKCYKIINDHIEEEIEPVEIKMSDMIKQLESSGYKVVNDLKETKEKTKKTKKRK